MQGNLSACHAIKEPPGKELTQENNNMTASSCRRSKTTELKNKKKAEMSKTEEDKQYTGETVAH